MSLMDAGSAAVARPRLDRDIVNEWTNELLDDWPMEWNELNWGKCKLSEENVTKAI